MTKELTRKPRDKPKPYNQQPKVQKVKDAPKTTAKPQKTKGENLTLADWLLVFAYIDKHPHNTQSEIVQHFQTRKEGILTFMQSSLSRNLKKREELERRPEQFPNALSSKRVRVVTRPDVERALVLWVRHMEEKGEYVTRPMLKEKRGRFEKCLNVPEAECLLGDGWIGPFCRAHKIKEHRQHGEAGSVDLDAVNAERKRMQNILASFKVED